MYAIVESGGKQYRVAPGDVIEVDRIDAKEGAAVELDRVLLIAEGKKVKVGTPVVEGAKVTADIVNEFKDKKITVFKYKNKTRYRRKKGHRQIYTKIAIKDIVS
ncbi:MAG: 50S ribosomal protein L21 [Dehalococcoidia bacterium]